MGLINILKHEYYITREEYLKILSTRNLFEALRSIIDKRFTHQLLEKIEKGDYTIKSILEQIEEFNLAVAHESLSNIRNKEFRDAVEAVYEVYATLVALINHQETGRFLSHIPSRSIRILGGSLEKPGRLIVNPYVDRLIGTYRALRKIDPDSVLRIYDSIRNGLRRTERYHEFLVAGLSYDLSLILLCSIPLFRDTSMRPILLGAMDLETICKLMEVDPLSSLEYLKKTRPLFANITSLLSDISKLAQRYESLEFVFYMYTPYISYQLLHTEESSEALKEYYLYMRQLFLTRLVLTLLHHQDETLMSYTRTLIERWVYP